MPPDRSTRSTSSILVRSNRDRRMPVDSIAFPVAYHGRFVATSPSSLRGFRRCHRRGYARPSFPLWSRRVKPAAFHGNARVLVPRTSRRYRIVSLRSVVLRAPDRTVALRRLGHSGYAPSKQSGSSVRPPSSRPKNRYAMPCDAMARSRLARLNRGLYRLQGLERMSATRVISYFFSHAINKDNG